LVYPVCLGKCKEGESAESAIISTRPEAEGMAFKWWKETLGSDYLYYHHGDRNFALKRVVRERISC
jgi:hypothetical protein